MSQRVTDQCRQACALQQVLIQAEQLDVAEWPWRMFGFSGRQPARDHGEQPVAGGQEVGELVTFGFRKRWPYRHRGITPGPARSRPSRRTSRR
jgi:hypothetical protein